MAIAVVKIKLFASLRENVGKGEIEAKIHGETAVGELLKGHKVLGKFVFEKGGRLKALYKVLINGRDIEGMKGLRTAVKPGDEVCIFPPVAGG